MLKSHNRLLSFFLVMVCSLSLGGVATGAELTTENLGGWQPHANMSPSIAMNYLIATQGTFPSRNGGTEPALGEISIFAGNFAPRGWAPCEGQLLPIMQNTSLFSVIGTTYGGDGRTTFALPDLRGRTPIGAGSGAGMTSRSVGDRGGAETVSVDLNETPSHTHSLPAAARNSGPAGGGDTHTNMQPWLAMNYLVPLQGVYPSRSLGGAESFLGSVELFAGDYAPRDTLLAQGQTLPISPNTALFSLLGTTYGGDGRTTFGLPDLQGRTAVHVGNGGGTSPRYALGQKQGVENATLNTAQMPNHNHTLPGLVDYTGDTGGGQAHTNIQPGLGLNYVIALTGVYPSRNFGGGADPLIAEVGMFAGNFAPRNWAFCDGQLLPISSNDALFSLLGTIYGGDGRTTFALPDLRGRSVMGVGNGPGLTSYRIGQKTGTNEVSLTSQQLASHNHTVPTSTWTGEDGGTWDTESNWDINRKPTGDHWAYLNNGNTAVLTQSGQQCAELFLGNVAGDVGKLEVSQGGSLSVTGGSYIGFGGSGTLSLASGGQFSSDTMFIGIGSSLRLHVGSDDMVVLGNGGSTGSMTNNGSIALFADAFLTGNTYTPISDFYDDPLLWSGSGTVDTFGGKWNDPSRTFERSPVITVNAGDMVPVSSNNRLLITDASSGDKVSVSFGDVAVPTTFSATVADNSDLLNLVASMPSNWSILGAWDFETNLPDGTEVFLAFEVESGLPTFQVWHLDGAGAWTIFDPEFKSYDSIGGIAGFTVDSFSGYAVTVPEPGTLALLSLGALVSLRRRRRRQK
jgi:microcystin-dependent protein